MQTTHLTKNFDGFYSILPNIGNLHKISNLAKNTRYYLTFNDYMTMFLTNEKGDLYFNNKKDPLPMQCLSEVYTRLSKIDYGKDSRNPDPPGDPIAYHNLDGYDCTKSRNMLLTLYDGKNFENVEFIISGGAIGRRFVPNNIEYYNENIFSGVGIL
jgi:hypothetical protein